MAAKTKPPNNDKSEAPGAGTTVTLYLPAAQGLAAGETAERAAQEKSASLGRVLVVEDDPDVLDVTVETCATSATRC
jgi:hypothetical protein